MDSKKNLLLIVSTLQLGGAERVAVNTALIFREEYNVKIAIFDGSNVAYDIPCDLIDLKLSAVPGKAGKVLNALRRANRLKQVKREHNIDCAMSFGGGANLANLLSKDMEVCLPTVRAYGLSHFSFYQRILYRRATKIGCVSKVIAERIGNENPELSSKLEVLYNPYDIPAMLSLGSEPVTDYVFGSHTIVSHGRLDEVKNYPRLIKAFSLVREKIPDAQLLIIGEGQQRQQLEKLIYTYHLTDSVTLLGFRKNPFAYLAKSSLYVLSSYSEGFPNALVEGMALLPAVAVDCKSGPREILSDGPINKVCCGWDKADYGVLVQPVATREFDDTITEDDCILADAILSVLPNPDKLVLLRTKARKRAGMFSYETYRDKLCNVFGNNDNEQKNFKE